MIDALRAGRIDAIARGEVGNRDAAHASGCGLAVTALDPEIELGGFALAVEDAALAACLSDKILWLTNGGQIGYAEWRRDRSVFMGRAKRWTPAEND